MVAAAASAIFGYKMIDDEIKDLLRRLCSGPGEAEWIEFKFNKSLPNQEIGEYLSALSNSARLNDQATGYLIFGIEDQTHRVIGTTFRPSRAKEGNQDLVMWLNSQLQPRVLFSVQETEIEGKLVSLFTIDAAMSEPVKFRGEAYCRVGPNKTSLKTQPELERKLWLPRQPDWSAQICEHASIADLDPMAVRRARDAFKLKNRELESEIDGWDDVSFLNKSRMLRNGKITNAAILLLGFDRSANYLSPAQARITWILKDASGSSLDYAHFGPPFLLTSEQVFLKVRNLTYRYLPNATLFPIEIEKYDPYLIREALHNCIAHQDYRLAGAVNVVEKPDELILVNSGNFLPGSIERVLQTDYPPEQYRNPLLAQAMVNFNMIDRIGSGIRRMFLRQRDRFFPLPDYNLSDPKKVVVSIPGKIIDENYTRLLLTKTDLDLPTVVALDKVQKRRELSDPEIQTLRRQRLIEGRKPNFFVSASIATLTNDSTRYVKNKAFDTKYYKDLILKFLEMHNTASRKEIDNLITDKLSDVLSAQQKRAKVKNLLYEMTTKDRSITNKGSKKGSRWAITDPLASSILNKT